MKKYIAIFLSAIMALFLLGNFICVNNKNETGSESSSFIEEISGVTAETLKPEIIQFESDGVVNTTEDNNYNIVTEKFDEKYDNDKSKTSTPKVQTKFTTESNNINNEVEIDDEVIELCNHDFCKTAGTGGEEGDVWDYVCIKCGYSYYEPRYDEGLEISDDDFENCNEASDVGSFVEAEETDSNDPTIDEESHDCEVSVLRTDEELE